MFTQVIYCWTQDSRFTLLAALLLAVVSPGIVAFTSDVKGLFDGYTLCWLLAALWVRKPWPMLLFLLLAYFSDERAVFAAGFIFLLQVFLQPAATAESGAGASWVEQDRPWWRKGVAWWIGGSIPVFLLLRLLFTQWLEIPYYQAGGITPSTVLNNLKLFTIALVLALEAVWLPALLGLLVVVGRRTPFQLLLAVVSLACILLVSLAVVEVARSLTYLLPFLVWSLVLWRQQNGSDLVLDVLFLAFLLSACIPAYSIGGQEIGVQQPLPVEILRWL